MKQRKITEKLHKTSNILPHEPLRQDISSPVNVSYSQPWMPGAYTSFKLLLSIRLCAAVWNIVGDCDETFNYWEPMHYLLFKKGFQTWEYAPQYAIRSYAYLWIHGLPLKLIHFIFGTNKVVLFYLLRCILAVCCSAAEVYFYKGICKHFGTNTGRITLLFLIMSAGMFISSTAFLPSSFCMYLTFISMGAWFLGKYSIAIAAVAASSILGWPFASILGIPIVVDLVFRRKKLTLFISHSLIALLVFSVPMVLIDYQYYGKLVVAPLNIIVYNVFTSHGPDLYGVEPLSYYILNGFLNFNLVFCFALVSVPFAMLVQYIVGIGDSDIPRWLALSPLYIWILIFFTRPHKEERFLFPIYPLFALCGAVTIDHVQKIWCYLFSQPVSGHYTTSTNWISASAGIIYSILGLARIVAIYQGYHAPLDLYLELNKISSDPNIHTLSPEKPVNVCVGKEWYRFPSHFFMPGDNWSLQFIQSEFKGQLPKPYSSGVDATKIVSPDFNDMNKEETSRYISSNKCHYLIDLDLPNQSDLEPSYSSQREDWKVISSHLFLDSSKSHRIFRAFYIPFVSSSYCHYVNYNILKTTKTKKSRH
ncbi:alpha-1,2-mannosyltransferase ALG9-like [Mytilus trossulus]|uniref:alpha-1,2-mannosyltransferase ALG9-like n=1 Tax=Mytilus trossulus TaxID=6551 RepID=UPI0030072103